MNSQLVVVFSASSKSMELHPFPSVQNLTPLFNIVFPHVYLLTNLEHLHLWNRVRTSKTNLETYNIISFFWKKKASPPNVNLTRLLIIYIYFSKWWFAFHVFLLLSTNCPSWFEVEITYICIAYTQITYDWSFLDFTTNWSDTGRYDRHTQ